MDKQHKREYLKSAMFGFTDALVSTTGVIVGVATGVGDKRIIVLAGIVTILVEAISMGGGQYLSQKSADQLSKTYNLGFAIKTGVVMFGSYFLAGLVPLLSIIIFPLDYAPFIAVGAAITALAIVGYIKAKIVGDAPIRSAVEVAVIGGIATFVGVVVGYVFGI